MTSLRPQYGAYLKPIINRPMSERLRLTENLEISRILTGLWQVADIEKDGTKIDPETGADRLAAYVAVCGAQAS